MTADYRADLAALARLRADLAPLADAAGEGYLAHYWMGYCDWRIALNGANRQMAAAELQAHLEAALSELESSSSSKSDFADAAAAASSVAGWLAIFHRDDRAAMMALIGRSRASLQRARQLAPDNPRVLWVVGGVYLFSPPAYGGDLEKALQTYRQAAQAAQSAAQPDSPLPDWGLPESFMSLAFAQLQKSPPEVDAAGEAAREALRLRPDWSYVRDVLIPQIDAARARIGAPK